MTIKDLLLKINELCDKEFADLTNEVYICIIREDYTEEKVKLSSISVCDGGYIPNGDENKDYLILDGEK